MHAMTPKKATRLFIRMWNQAAMGSGLVRNDARQFILDEYDWRVRDEYEIILKDYPKSEIDELVKKFFECVFFEEYTFKMSWDRDYSPVDTMIWLAIRWLKTITSN